MGHRPFTNHDSFRHIDWKAYARHQKLNIKLFESEDRGTQILSWVSTNPALSVEDRLSQLALWVDLCAHHKFSFVLDLPHWRSAADHTGAHVKECLTQLALFDSRSPEKRPA
jgi:uncharacterized protein (DUF58 family)